MSGKSVGILTFHNYDNYGAILQSYCLQAKLKELGYAPEIIDYDCEYISNPFRLVNLKEKGLFNYIYGAIGHICYLPRRRKCQKFRKENMKYSVPVRKGRMDAVSDCYDYYVVGSDQIWDYKLTNGDMTYFLDFVKNDKKKYSYAASIGEHLPPKELRKKYSAFLNRFERILVRENYGADIVEELTGKRPDCVCDPTLLLRPEEWKPFVKKPVKKGRYILVYQLGINPEIVAFARRIAKKTGFRIVYIPFPLVGLLKCSCQIAIGPSEWLGLFENAEYVISDSFHGVVFSLLFNRPFFTMVNGHHTNKRVEQLLKTVGLSHRVIDNVPDQELTAPIDFSYANQQIEAMRTESLQRLRDMMDGN